ncbi:MAG: hypothetical protein JWM27_4290, partial [Gemmatimonadetes bacterium]|nr:hypothetical protein [Gemmatimonadota bacterium]
MSRAPLAFRALGVRRMPGIADGGWELAGLSPGVNVVWGPNGAGKTTSASALERLLWPGAFHDGRPVLDARLSIGPEEWSVAMDGAAIRWQREGQETSAPTGLPPATERDRYRLSLHELLDATDQPLAERILHESAGGFDVGRAAEALGFRASARNPTTQRNALSDARARVATAADDQARLRDDASRLEDLRAEAAGHQAAAARRDLLTRALERMDAGDAERAAGEALAAFPAEAGQVQGDEADRLRALRSAIQDAHKRARDAERDADGARGMLAQTDLPSTGLPGDVIARMNAALGRLQDLEQTILRLGRELEGAREACRAERASVAGAVGDEAMAALVLPDVEDLLAFARAAEQHRAATDAAKAELEWLAGDAPVADVDALRRGRDALSAWLREPAAEARGGPARTIA